MRQVFISFVISVLLSGCGSETRSGWVEIPVPEEIEANSSNNYLHSGKSYLQVQGYDLSSGLEEAVMIYTTIDDLVSGGEKTIFTLTLNGKSSSNDVVITTPDNQEVIFHCYDGIIFNIDSESHDIERMIELMNFEELKFRQDGYEFTIKTKGFDYGKYILNKTTKTS